MHSIVKRLRQRGIRLADRDIAASVGVHGELRIAICGHQPRANLSDPNDQQFNPLIPQLVNAHLVTMHGDGLLLHGIERDPAGAEYVQEWSVKVLQQP
jgi:hypothetical protein